MKVPTGAFVARRSGKVFITGNSGFPKSRNISKALTQEGHPEEAVKWDGWGTALKPAVETWWLARKPLREKTVAEQVLATGTGAINIDGTRVATSVSDAKAMERCNTLGSGRMRTATSPIGTFTRSNSSGELDTSRGRWPANVTLEHGPDCKRIGTKKVITGTALEPDFKKMNRSVYGDTNTLGRTCGYAAEDGTETVDSWECAPSCPVRALDEQSGERRNAGLYPSDASHKQVNAGLATLQQGQLYEDSGGASRFFNQFEPDPEAPPFVYTGKITAGERKEDLEEGGLINKHPTVKSRKLMSHLVKLITPPEGRVLDPFAGSGSTLVAALSLGMSAVGIEQDPEYHKIASQRLGKTLERELGKQEIQALNDDIFCS